MERPVAFYSIPPETRYSAVELECLAVVEGVKHFRVYVTGVPFSIQTDHRCLVYLDRLKDESSRLTRWALSLQPYDYTILDKKMETRMPSADKPGKAQPSPKRRKGKASEPEAFGEQEQN